MEETVSGKLIRRNACASTESDQHLVMNIESTKELESSEPDLLSPNRCIYKVPDHLRKLNEMSYTPRVISIGPLHHGNKKLQTMENYKVKYLNDFVLRAQTSLEDLVRIVKDSEEMVRECYAEDIELNSDEFVNMILRDAAFIIEYFLRNRFPKQWTDEDKIVIKPWLTARMQLDFLLLENQLPFFIIEKLYEFLLVTDTTNYPPFIEVTFSYFSFLNPQDHKYSSRSEFRIIKHFVDLLRSFYLPLQAGRDLFFEKQGRISERKYGNDHYVEEMYSASQLAEAGLIFKKSASRCQLDIKFKDGVLEIPGFTLDKSTELYARNLMALEELHDYPTAAYITDYFRFLDFLIDTDKDVGLLRRKKILVNRLGDNCAAIVNNLCSNDVAETPTVYYYQLCRELVDFYYNPWNSNWKIKLRRDLSTPWVIVTTTSAIFLLVLTLVQTVCTVISTVK